MDGISRIDDNDHSHLIISPSELAEKLCFELNSSKLIQELDLSKTKFVPVLNEDWGSPIVNKQCEIQPHLLFFIIWFILYYMVHDFVLGVFMTAE